MARSVELGALLAAVLFALNAPTAGAQPSSAQELRALLSEAREKNPGVQAAKMRWKASVAQARAEGAWPDPMVEAGTMSVTRWMPQLYVTQGVPAPGKLDLSRRVAEQEAVSSFYAYVGALAGLEAQVRQAYYELGYQQQALDIVQASKKLLDGMTRLASNRYALAQGAQSDVLRLHSEMAELLKEEQGLRREKESASIRLQALLSRAPGTPLSVKAPQGLAPLPAYARSADAAIAEAIARSPSLAMSRAEVLKSSAALDLAQVNERPDFQVRVGVSPLVVEGGMMESALSGMVGVTLPVYGRARAERESAEQTLEARRLQGQEEARELSGRLQETLVQLKRLSEQYALSQNALLPKARQAFEAVLAEYQVGRADVEAVLRARADLYRYERESRRMATDYHQRLSELETLSGQVAAPEEKAP